MNTKWWTHSSIQQISLNWEHNFFFSFSFFFFVVFISHFINSTFSFLNLSCFLTFSFLFYVLFFCFWWFCFLPFHDNKYLSALQYTVNRIRLTCATLFIVVIMINYFRFCYYRTHSTTKICWTVSDERIQ